MRNLLSLLLIVVFLGVALPAQAQLREHAHMQQAQARLYGQDGPAFTLNRLFSPDHFQMNHTYEMSFGSFGGHSSSLGMYTNTMSFQFSQKLAARVDMSYAFSPFGSMNPLGPEADHGRFFLRNAEVAYRPAENVRIHLNVRQSPYGSYMNPYGYGRYDRGFHDGFRRSDDLFWNERFR